MYNILIVDDEKIIRNGIRDVLIEIDYFQVITVDNGEKALGIIKNQRVNGIILDIKMPRMDGLELLQILVEQEINIPTIILSGYDEFEYARKAIKYDVIDYRLKPIVPDDILDIANKLKKVIEERERERKEITFLRESLKENKLLRKKSIFRDLLTGSIDKEKYIKIINSFGESYRGNFFRLALLTTGFSVTDLKDKPHSGFSTENILEIMRGYLAKDIGYCIFPFEDNLFAIIFNGSNEEQLNDKQVLKILENLQKDLEQYKDILITIGLGDIFLEIENIKYSYYQALTALKHELTMGSGSIYSIKDFTDRNQVFNFNINRDKIISLVKIGEKEEIIKEIKETFCLIKESEKKPGLYNIYVLATEYLIVLLSIVQESKISLDNLFATSINPFIEIYNKQTINDLENWLINLVDNLTDLILDYQKDKDLKLIEDIKKYIRENYEKSITNKILSDFTGYSPNYIGKLFKEETGITVNEYLNKTRINKAKTLVKNNSLLIYQVANRVGFNDQHYFSSVFKKIVGVSPSEYREL